MTPVMSLEQEEAHSDIDQQEVLRVLTYDIRHARGVDGVVDLDRIAKDLAGTGADIVALQEVDRGVERSGSTDMPELLAVQMGMTAYFGSNIAVGGGDYGNAVITNLPVLEWGNILLPVYDGGEQRGLLWLVLEIRESTVLLLNTHLDHRPDESERLQSVAVARQFADSMGLPVIWAGDFNATPDSSTYHVLRQFLADSWSEVGEGPGWTFPSVEPSRRIDYIFYGRSLRWTAASARVIETQASDHRPLLIEFRPLVLRTSKFENRLRKYSPSFPL